MVGMYGLVSDKEGKKMRLSLLKDHLMVVVVKS